MSKRIKQLLVSASAILMITGVGASANNVNVNAKRHHARTHRVYHHHSHKRIKRNRNYHHAKKHSITSINLAKLLPKHTWHDTTTIAGKSHSTDLVKFTDYSLRGSSHGDHINVPLRLHRHTITSSNGPTYVVQKLVRRTGKTLYIRTVRMSNKGSHKNVIHGKYMIVEGHRVKAPTIKLSQDS